MLPRTGNTDVMIEVDHTVIFCLMTKRRINLVRSILDYTLSAIDAARRSHAVLPYGMLFTHVFTRAQLPVDGHRKDEKCPTTTMKTFTAMGLKLQGLKKEEKKKKKEEAKKEEKKKDPRKKDTSLQKVKMKPSEEMRKKKRQEISLSPSSEGKRVRKRRLLKLPEETSSS